MQCIIPKNKMHLVSIGLFPALRECIRDTLAVSLRFRPIAPPSTCPLRRNTNRFFFPQIDFWCSLKRAPWLLRPRLDSKSQPFYLFAKDENIRAIYSNWSIIQICVPCLCKTFSGEQSLTVDLANTSEAPLMLCISLTARHPFEVGEWAVLYSGEQIRMGPLELLRFSTAVLPVKTGVHGGMVNQ